MRENGGAESSRGFFRRFAPGNEKRGTVLFDEGSGSIRLNSSCRHGLQPHSQLVVANLDAGNIARNDVLIRWVVLAGDASSLAKMLRHRLAHGSFDIDGRNADDGVAGRFGNPPQIGLWTRSDSERRALLRALAPYGDRLHQRAGRAAKPPFCFAALPDAIAARSVWPAPPQRVHAPTAVAGTG